MCISCWQEYGSPKIKNENVFDAVYAVREVYDSDMMGGRLHIVIEDWNLDNESLEWCNALGLDDLERKCFDALSLLSIDERASVLAIFEGLVR